MYISRIVIYLHEIGLMKLGERQELFMRLLPRLIDKAHELGFEIRGGDLFRDPRLHGEVGKPSLKKFLKKFIGSAHNRTIEDAGYLHYGNPHSQHKNKCAIDLNLRHPETGMVWSSEGHRELGEWWEKQHPMCRWGGRYNDGNHYELLPWR
jgi:hypothetical protein